MMPLTLSVTALTLLAIACILLVRRQVRMAARIASLEAETRWYQDALRIAGAGVWQWNLNENTWKWIEDVFHVNGSGLAYRVAINEEFHSHVHPEDRERQIALEQECLHGRQSLINDYRYRLDNGEERWLRDIGRLVPGNPPMLVGVTLDVTDEKLAALAEKRRLNRDDLTDLPNRRALTEWLDARVAGGSAASIGFVDLNGFKQINDRHGHAAGDRLLKAIGRALTDRLAPGEFAARIGGDEFILVVDAASDGRDVDRIRVLVNRALLAANASVPKGQVGAAVGIARMPDDATTTEGLLRVADVAMYGAKATKQRVAFRLADQLSPPTPLSA